MTLNKLSGALANKVVFALLAIVPLSVSGDVHQFLLGDYFLIGTPPDSDETYHGKVSIYESEGIMKVKRRIGEKTIYGEAGIEPALHGEAKVLRIRFESDGIAYEETCLWQGDLDNYARISCYLYESGVRTERPGMEALFHDHTAD